MFGKISLIFYSRVLRKNNNAMTTYTILQAVISPHTDEKINIGVLLSDGQRTAWEFSSKKLDILRLWRGEEAYQMVKRISDNLQASDEFRRAIMTPEQLSYLHRYCNNLLTVSPAQSTPSPLETSLAQSLFHQVIDTVQA